MVAMQMLALRAMDALRNLREEESGQGLVEYSLIIALVSVALVAALGALTGNIETVFEAIDTALPG